MQQSIMLEHQQSRNVTADLIHSLENMMLSSSAAITWLDRDRNYHSTQTKGISDNFLSYYMKSIKNIDPLGLTVLEGNSRQCKYRHLSSENEHRKCTRYISFIENYGYKDELSLYFFEEGIPVAIMSSLCRSHIDFDTDYIIGVYDMISRLIKHHPIFKSARRSERLQKDWNLTPREIDVAELIRHGASNSDIASNLGILTSTIKTHVIHILGKMGVDSRS